MKKIGIFTALFGAVFGFSGAANAAYPAHQAYQPANTYQATNAQGQIIYLPSGVPLPANSRVVGGTAVTMPQNNYNTQKPTRITGALPRVGSAASTAGRQYYQPADYDRLADSGLYIGVSVAYSASTMGNMHADYTGEQNAFFVPGAFKDADFDTDTVIPLQLSVGAAINNDVRIDFSYLRYSGLEYPGRVQSSDGAGGYVEASVDGGAITANATMLNVYYNIDTFTGYIAGGSLRPYIGAGVGISLNTIADYVVYDNTFYSEKEPVGAYPGELTGISDIYAYHNGGTEEQFAFMLEGGVTTELQNGLKLDLFARYANLGKVKTSGSIIVSQTEWLATDEVDAYGNPILEKPAPYDSVFHYTNWYESGRIGMVDIGARLRLQF